MRVKINNSQYLEKMILSESHKIYWFIRLMRLHAPVGSLLLLFPSWWGLAFGSLHFPTIKNLYLFGLGAMIMRSAGCVYNDWIDQDIDRKVKRTQNRPLARKEINSSQVFILLVILLLCGFFILLNLPYKAILLGIIALGLILVYPWMKQIFAWPQLFLGLTFNWGVFMGVLSAGSDLGFFAILLFIGGLLWTIGYDTIYALQDYSDDLLLGVQSTAVAWGAFTPYCIGICYACSLMCFSLVSFAFSKPWPYLISLGGAAIHMLWQVLTLKISNSSNCHNRFVSNIWIGFFIFLGIVFSRLLD